MKRGNLLKMMKNETKWEKPEDHPAVHPSLEAQLVNLGDEIAYQNHDVDDGLRSGLFTEEDLENLELWVLAKQAVQNSYGTIPDEKIRWARTVSKMIGLMIHDIAEETSTRLREHGIQTLEDVYACPDKLVGFSPKMASINDDLKQFLVNRLYFSKEVLEHTDRGKATIRILFDHLLQEMGPEDARDYLAGMTDHFALEQAAQLASPSEPSA